jgi:hypothetical protein
MNDVGLPGRHLAVTEFGCHLGERGEAKRVVRPLDSTGRDVGVARPRVEVLRVDHQQLNAGRVAAEHARRPAEQLVDGVHDAG